MRFYAEYIKTSFYKGLTYRFDYFMRLMGTFFYLFAQFYIWRALLGQQVEHTEYGAISFSQMTTYIILSSIVTALLSTNVISGMNGKIRTGQIAVDMIKPVNIKGLFFCDSISENLFRCIFHLLPVAVVSISLFGISIPTAFNTVCFIVTLINGIILYFLMGYVFGVLGFWFTQVWILERLLSDFVRLFAGSIIPLWFFPTWLQKVSLVLPFRLIYFTPISIYMNMYDQFEVIWLIGQQWLWIVGLYFLGWLVWAKGIHKLVVQGG